MDPREILTVPFGDRINLTTPWLFHEGHDPAYASPTLNDSDWQVLDTSRPVFTSGLYNLNEIWYRTHIRVAPFSHNLALTVAGFGGSYRVLVNGQELGGYGRMSGRGDFLIARSATFSIPNALLEQGDLVVVIHAFVGTVDRASFTLEDGISPKSSIFLGPAGILHRDERFYYATGLSESAGVLTLWTVLLVLAIALSFLIPSTPVYPLLTVFAGGHLIGFLLQDFADFHYLPRTHWLAWPIRLALLASDLAALEFCRIIADVRRRFWFIAFEVFYILAASSLFFAAIGAVSYLLYTFLLRLSFGLLLAVIFALLLLGVRRRKPDSVILVSVGALYLFYLLVWWALQHIVFEYSLLNRLADSFGNALRPGPIGDLAIVSGFLALTLVRTLRIVRERASIATEIQAARTMQQLLLSRTAEPTPGFAIETVYYPAGEVGGDFFLVTPNPDGSITIILGDVSGKGLLAAMRVALILGVLRREPSRHPAIMLQGLNDALVSQGHEGVQMGFTTAIAVRVEPSGHYTVSNAGHLSPYVLGHETATPPSLPLGLAPEQTYETVSGQIQPGERLVLLSDGVPEARTPKGELYGFDRLPSLTLEPASFIASTARAFGQEDDITVVTIACLPASAAPPPPHTATAPPPPRVVVAG
jgi:sigma-B regulation protein RsbU (phosphoserine phosphatase)